MDVVIKSLVACFKERTPLSEDLLFLGWKWSARSVEGGTSKSLLWTSLKETLSKVLAIPLNKTDWVWFKMNLLGTSVETPPLFLSFPFSHSRPHNYSYGLKNLTNPTRLYVFAGIPYRKWKFDKRMEEEVFDAMVVE